MRPSGWGKFSPIVERTAQLWTWVVLAFRIAVRAPCTDLHSAEVEPAAKCGFVRRRGRRLGAACEVSPTFRIGEAGHC